MQPETLKKAIRLDADGFFLLVKVQAGAKNTTVLDVVEVAPYMGFTHALKISVTQAPEKGKANKIVLKLLGKYFACAPSSLKIVQGETNALKIIQLPSSPIKKYNLE